MKRYWPIQCCIATVAVLVFVYSVFAAGVWISGEVDAAPYYEDNYRYIVVSETRYTIMDEAVAHEVLTEEDEMYKPLIDIEDIRKGDRIRVLAEGNSVYQIEILR